MSTRFHFKIPSRWHHQPLSELLVQCIPESSLQQWYLRWQQGQIRVQGMVPEWVQLLIQGQLLEYWIDDYQEPDVPSDWSVLWEDEQLLAVHKPAGLAVSRTTRNPTQHLIGLVQQSGFDDAHLLHRLDKETSGILMLAKSANWASLWQPQLKTLMVEKTYLAKVWGMPDWQEYHMRCDLTTRSESPIRCQMYVCHDGEPGKFSESYFKVRQSDGVQSLIECRLFTGRKHQIRAHLAYLGHPIVGDKIYAHHGEYYLKRLQNKLTDSDRQTLGSPHHCLHSYRLKINVHEEYFYILDTKCNFWPII
ncbi:RluA family pseudouridine synthase [Celerinatantimonas sp. YJH-8]|uniref:RluA family pseudouridine synthase n=1 Tax=Celerinatantimonas sp. YJH-8 TaxID=3228714 RepID=UPI0038C9605E